jgi:hypothetical protein
VVGAVEDVDGIVESVDSAVVCVVEDVDDIAEGVAGTVCVVGSEEDDDSIIEDVDGRPRLRFG